MIRQVCINGNRLGSIGYGVIARIITTECLTLSNETKLAIFPQFYTYLCY